MKRLATVGVYDFDLDTLLAALEAADVGELGVGRDDADRLARVLWRAAADADEAVRARSDERCHPGLDVLDGRVGGHVVEHRVGEACGVEVVGDAPGDAVAGEGGVGDDERLGVALADQLARDVRHGAATEPRGLVEDHPMGHGATPRTAPLAGHCVQGPGTRVSRGPPGIAPPSVPRRARATSGHSSRISGKPGRTGQLETGPGWHVTQDTHLSRANLLENSCLTQPFW